MPYTPDAADVANPLDVGIKATTAPWEFRTMKIYIAGILAGTILATKLAITKSAAGLTQELLRLENSGAGANAKARIAFYGNATLYGAVQAGYGATMPELNFLLPSGTPGAFSWVDGATTRMLLNNAGNLGVGTSAPATNLDVLGAADGGVQYRTGTTTTGVGQVSGVPTVYWGSTTDLSFFSGSERARMKSTGQFRLIPVASDPAGAQAGDLYYNSTTNKHRGYNGTTWNDLY